MLCVPACAVWRRCCFFRHGGSSTVEVKAEECDLWASYFSKHLQYKEKSRCKPKVEVSASLAMFFFFLFCAALWLRDCTYSTMGGDTKTCRTAAVIEHGWMDVCTRHQFSEEVIFYRGSNLKKLIFADVLFLYRVPRIVVHNWKQNARNWPPKKPPKKCLCLESWEAESGITRVCSDHSVKRTFCGFVCVTLACSRLFLHSVTLKLVCLLAFIGACTSATQHQCEFYGAPPSY